LPNFVQPTIIAARISQAFAVIKECDRATHKRALAALGPAYDWQVLRDDVPDSRH